MVNGNNLRTAPELSVQELELHPLDQLEAYQRQYVDVNEHVSALAALYTAYACRAQDFASSAYLYIRSDSEESGKTTLADLIARFVPHHLSLSGTTPANFRRTLKEQQGAGHKHVLVVLDEVDEHLRKNTDLVPYLNESHSRGKPFSWRVWDERAKDWTQEEVDAFGAKILIGIGHLPSGPLSSRCITINMVRRPLDAPFLPIDWGEEGEEGLDNLRVKLHAFVDGIEVPEPRTLPEEFWPPLIRASGRKAKMWMPLFVMADAAGGTWPERARKAAVALSFSSSGGLSPQHRMLCDVARLFAWNPEEPEFMSRDLAAKLSNEPFEWPLYRNENGTPWLPDNCNIHMSKLLRSAGVEQHKTAAGMVWKREEVEKRVRELGLSGEV